MQLQLPLIEKKNSALIGALSILGIANILFTAVDLTFFSGNQAVWVIAAAISIWIAYAIRNYRVIGRIILSADAIVVKSQTSISTFPIPQIQNLKILLLEIQGKSVGFSMAMQRGSGNMINFQYNGKQVKIEFLLEQETQAALGTIIHQWSQVTRIKCYNSVGVKIG